VSVGLGGVGARSAQAASPGRPVQEESTTTTRPELLVPGPAVATTTSTAASASTSTTDAAGGFFDDVRADIRDMVADETGRTVAIAIGGLVLVALILAILTIRYWRKTRPVRPPKSADG
jgi:hypothetical protein